MTTPHPTPTPLASTAMEAARELLEKLARDTGAYSTHHVLDPQDREALKQFIKSRDTYRDVLKYFGLAIVNEAEEGALMLMTDEKKDGTKECVFVRPIRGGSYAKDQSELALLRKEVEHFQPLLAKVEECERWKKHYYDVADAITKESSGPVNLIAQVRALRADLAAKEAALAHYAHADFLTTEQQKIADNALKPHAT